MPAASKTKRPRKAAKKKSARAAPGISLASALAEAAWAEADAALAQALADLDELANAPTEAARAEVMVLLTQSLSRAARKRGLSRIGALGGRESYRPNRHDLIDSSAKKPRMVRIQARGVARGAEILVKPRVGPVGRKKRS